MLLQEFQQNILSKGEVSLMVMGGKYTHAIIKRAKKGDFRVQDDFGGTVDRYNANQNEISFAERVVSVLDEIPAYARVDIIWNNRNEICVSELELIEPELWFRNDHRSATTLAKYIKEKHF